MQKLVEKEDETGSVDFEEQRAMEQRLKQMKNEKIRSGGGESDSSNSTVVASQDNPLVLNKRSKRNVSVSPSPSPTPSAKQQRRAESAAPGGTSPSPRARERCRPCSRRPPAAAPQRGRQRPERRAARRGRPRTRATGRVRPAPRRRGSAPRREEGSRPSRLPRARRHRPCGHLQRRRPWSINSRT